MPERSSTSAWRPPRPDRSAIVADAIEELDVQPARRPVTERSPRERILALVGHLAQAIRYSKVSACMPALIEGAEHDPTLRHLHHDHAEGRRAALVEAIAEARLAGEVRAEVDPELAAVALAGAIAYRRLLTARALADDVVGRLVETVLGGDPARAR